MRSRAVLLALALLVGGSRLAAGQASKGAAAGQVRGSAAVSQADREAAVPGAGASPKRLGRSYPAASTLQPKARPYPQVYVFVVRPQQANLGGRRAGSQLRSRRNGAQAGLEAQMPAAPGVPLGLPLR